MEPAEARPRLERRQGWDEARVRQRLLKLDTRRRIYEHVRDNPGVHLRRLVRESGLALGTVEHHLHLLTRHGLIESRFPGPRRRCYFVRTGIPQPGNDVVALARTPALRRVLELLSSTDDVEAPEVAEGLGISDATASYHLNRLVEWNVADSLRIGRSRVYRLRAPDTVRMALLQSRNRLEAAMDAPPADQSVLQYLLARIPADPRPAVAPPQAQRIIDA